MNFDFGFITEVTKQFLGMFLGIFQVSTANGQSMLKMIDFFGSLGNFFIQVITKIASLFNGAGG